MLCWPGLRLAIGAEAREQGLGYAEVQATFGWGRLGWARCRERLAEAGSAGLGEGRGWAGLGLACLGEGRAGLGGWGGVGLACLGEGRAGLGGWAGVGLACLGEGRTGLGRGRFGSAVAGLPGLFNQGMRFLGKFNRQSKLLSIPNCDLLSWVRLGMPGWELIRKCLAGAGLAALGAGSAWLGFFQLKKKLKTEERRGGLTKQSRYEINRGRLGRAFQSRYEINRAGAGFVFADVRQRQGWAKACGHLEAALGAIMWLETLQTKKQENKETK
ncbi:hypothetical protein BY996DRAFT_6539273 [Phakopsora pachyrhizi]|nr:hypothetical protein BY996DRAFT_6539273 [Phakopsora pachyrhizi]